MSFVHYLTIGRFGFREDAPQPGLSQRVVAHFVPGGLKQLQGETRSVEPFTDDELTQLQLEARRRFELDVDLRQFLTEEGLLCIQYLWMPVQIAWIVASVAHELFGAVAGERGHMYSADAIERHIPRDVQLNAVHRRLKAIANPAERVREALRATQGGVRDEPAISVVTALDTVKGLGVAALPELLVTLSTHDTNAQQFALEAIHQLGRQAAGAIPVLIDVIRDPDRTRNVVGTAVSALAALGPGAEAELVLALDRDDATYRGCAIRGLGSLGSISDAARIRLEQVAEEEGDFALDAKLALSRLGHNPWGIS